MSLSTASDYCLNIISQLVFLMEMKSFLCEVRTAFLIIGMFQISIGHEGP